MSTEKRVALYVVLALLAVVVVWTLFRGEDVPPNTAWLLGSILTVVFGASKNIPEWLGRRVGPSPGQPGSPQGEPSEPAGAMPPMPDELRK